MNTTLYSIACIICIVFLHIYISFSGVSIVLAPVAIAVALSTIISISPLWIAGLGLLAETISTLPFGTILVAMLLPVILRSLIKQHNFVISWKTFSKIGLLVTLSISWILIIMHLPFPLLPTTLQVVITSCVAFAGSAIYHEYKT